jgi:hypothetical protein
VDLDRIIVLETNLTEIGAFAIERRLIRWFGRKDLRSGILLNRTDGGDGQTGHKVWAQGRTVSAETRRKIGEASKGRFTGTKQTAEHIQKRIESKSWYSHSKEVRKQISESNRKPNPKLSDTIKKKGGRRGENNPHYGKQTSDENKAKFMKLFGKPFMADGVEYYSIGDCHRKTGIPSGTIYGRLKSGKYIYIASLEALCLEEENGKNQ